MTLGPSERRYRSWLTICRWQTGRSISPRKGGCHNTLGAAGSRSNHSAPDIPRRPAARRRRRSLPTEHSPRAILLWQTALRHSIVPFGRSPGARVVTAAPDEAIGAQADLTVFDGVTPRSMLTGPMILIHPPGDNGIVQVTGDLRLPPITTVDSTHPFLTGVDMSAVRLNRADRLSLPSWGHTVLGSPRGPLIVEGIRDGQPIAIFAFDPVASGFEKSIGFQSWWPTPCRQPWPESPVHPYDPGRRSASLRPPMDAPRSSSGPDGQRDTLATRRPGDSVQPNGSNRSLQRAGCLHSTHEAHILSQPAQSDRIQHRPRPMPAVAPRQVDESGLQRLSTEWWWPMIAAAIGLLAVEWLVFARRG